MLFQLVVVVNPTTDALQQMDRYDRACGAARPEGHAQIPHGAMALAPSAFAVWVAAGEIAFDERAAQGFRLQAGATSPSPGGASVRRGARVSTVLLLPSYDRKIITPNVPKRKCEFMFVRISL